MKADPEVKPKKTRRRFTVQYKLEILEKAENCEEGELGALLRKEGLYYAYIKKWRRQQKQGTLADNKRGRKPKEINPLEEKVAQLEKEKSRLEKKLQRAEKIIEFQKKIAEFLEVAG